VDERTAEQAQAALDEALRARVEQDDRLRGLRSTAALALSIAAVAAAAFGIGRTNRGLAAAGAAVALGVLVCAVAGAHWPRRWFEPANVDDLIRNYVDADDAPGMPQMTRDLAVIHYGIWLDNEESVRTVRRYVVISLVALGIMVALLLVDMVVSDDAQPASAGPTSTVTTEQPS
jgi:hypothetical protein